MSERPQLRDVLLTFSRGLQQQIHLFELTTLRAQETGAAKDWAEAKMIWDNIKRGIDRFEKDVFLFRFQTPQPAEMRRAQPRQAKLEVPGPMDTFTRKES